MKSFKKSLSGAVASLLLTACAVTTTDSIAVLQESGFEPIDGGGAALIGDTGATYVDVDNAWVTLYAADGRKVVKMMESGELTNRSWRINDDGVFCHELFKTGEEQCEHENFVYLKNEQGIHAIVRDGKDMKLRFKVIPGNSENL